MIRDGVFVDIAQRAFLGANATREVAEVIDCQRDIGIERFANRLAVVNGFCVGQQLEIRLDAVRDFQQDVGAVRGGCLSPGVGGSVRCIESQFDILGARACNLRVHLTGDRCDDVEILILGWGDPLAANEVVVLGFVGDFGAGGTGLCIKHLLVSSDGK